MDNKQVMELAKEYGITTSRKTLFSWRRGYYTVGTEKKWYFKDHTRLPFETSLQGKGYTYSEAAVRAWLKMLSSR